MRAESSRLAALRVYAADGTEIHGITSITLTAKAGDIWRANIECMVKVGEINAEVEVTALADTSRVYNEVKVGLGESTLKSIEQAISRGLRKKESPTGSRMRYCQ